MRGTSLRCLILTAILTVGALSLIPIQRPRAAPPARWPSEDALYAVEGWAAGPLALEAERGGSVSRAYARPDGMTATLVIMSSPEAKHVYRAGAEIPFLGGGQATEPAPPSLVPPAPGRTALLVGGADARSLAVYAVGERRGLLGNGALGWGLFALDATLGRPNDYFKLYLLAPLRRPDASDARLAAALADVLFPRVAAWYAD